MSNSNRDFGDLFLNLVVIVGALCIVLLVGGGLYAGYEAWAHPSPPSGPTKTEVMHAKLERINSGRDYIDERVRENRERLQRVNHATTPAERTEALEQLQYRQNQVILPGAFISNAR